MMAKKIAKGIVVLINDCAGWTDNFRWNNVECGSDDLVLSEESEGVYYNNGERVSKPVVIPPHTESLIEADGVDIKKARVDVLVIGGGGGGGRHAGGGGAGGLVFRKGESIGGKLTVRVGAGGTGAGTDLEPGNNGTKSIFGKIIAFGGGGGGSETFIPPYIGGSGGGGAISTNGASGIEGQGNKGGAGEYHASFGNRAGGGGGGAGENGHDGVSNNGGNGGNGLKEVTIGTTTYNFADLFGTTYGIDEDSDGNRWFAGGGGGYNLNNPNSGVGGKGGGGTNTDNGVANTGSGGAGGAGYDGTGGSGIVLVRYKTDGSDGINPLTAIGGIKYTHGDYTIHAFLSDDEFDTTTKTTEVKLYTGVSDENAKEPGANIDVLLVGGGGGAGRGNSGTAWNPGAGGGGGVVVREKYHINKSEYSVVVGSGGGGGSRDRVRAPSGQDTKFDNLIAYGGGGGGAATSTTGSHRGGPGGSGGGRGSRAAGVGEGIQSLSETGGFGNDGSRGGGGAGAVADGNTGGAGKEVWGTTYGKGGNASANNASGSGGSGNGGDAPNDWSTNNGGAGGSGRVIIRYKTDGSDGINPDNASGGTKSTSGDYTVHNFTSSGTFETGINNGYEQAENNKEIENLVAGKYLYVKQVLSTDDTDETPALESLRVEIK